MGNPVTVSVIKNILICKTNFHPYMTCRGSYYFRISDVEITYS